MKNKVLLLAVIAMAVCATTAMLFKSRPAGETPVPAKTSVASITAPSPVEAVVPDAKPVSTNAPENASAPEKIPAEPAGNPAQNNSANPKQPLQDPDARAALSFVGADPDADACWLAAICDPSLPDQEREDLMEDLNEDGLSDPKLPGPEDVPLIANRIQIIEEIAPYADDFMLEHLGEAYKDLHNLLAGEPVQ